MPYAIGYEYVERYFSENEKRKVRTESQAQDEKLNTATPSAFCDFKQAEELVNNIIESFIEDLREIEWMDQETRARAIEKARNMVVAVGYDETCNKTCVDEDYAAVSAGKHSMKPGSKLILNNAFRHSWEIILCKNAWAIIAYYSSRNLAFS